MPLENRARFTNTRVFNIPFVLLLLFLFVCFVFLSFLFRNMKCLLLRGSPLFVKRTWGSVKGSDENVHLTFYLKKKLPATNFSLITAFFYIIPSSANLKGRPALFNNASGHRWSRRQKNEQRNNVPSPKKNNAAAGYQGPVKIELYQGVGLLNVQAIVPLEVLKTKTATVVGYSGFKRETKCEQTTPTTDI